MLGEDGGSIQLFIGVLLVMECNSSQYLDFSILCGEGYGTDTEDRENILYRESFEKKAKNVKELHMTRR